MSDSNTTSPPLTAAGNGDEWFDTSVELGFGWDTTTPGVPLNPRNYQRLMRNEIRRALGIVDRVLDKHRARMRKEFGEQMLEMKTKMLEEARAEIRRALSSDEAVVDLDDLRRHGRRAA
jgi:hypothetical protein